MHPILFIDIDSQLRSSSLPPLAQALCLEHEEVANLNKRACSMHDILALSPCCLVFGTPDQDHVKAEQVAKLAKCFPETPIIIVSDEFTIDRTSMLRAGVDCVLDRSIPLEEQALCIAAVARRKRRSTELEFGDLRIVFGEQRAFYGETELLLTTIEFRILSILCETPGAMQSRQNLFFRVWGYTETVQSRTLDTHIKRLRTKLEEHGIVIETHRGKGYKVSQAVDSGRIKIAA
jgi:two-component system, OmpR family, phosphate regulon response regulator PhoB